MEAYVAQNFTTLSNNSFYNSFLLNYTNNEFILNFFNVCLYQSNFDVIITSNNNTEILTYFKSFLKNISKDVKASADTLNIPVKNYLNTLYILQQILEIRGDISSRLLSYDNILVHFPNSDPNIVKLFQEVSDNRYTTIQEFRTHLDKLIGEIKVYNETQVLKNIINQWYLLYNEVSEGNSSALTWLKNFRDIVQTSHSNLADLKVLATEETVSNYMLFYDKESVKPVIKNLVHFLGTSFAHFKTGFEIFDNNIDGIESSSVTVITGPSNHAKSLFMINIINQIISNVKNSYDTKDAFILITLEDDVHKLFRRLLSVFGNNDSKIIKKIYEKCSTLLKEQENTDIKNRKLIESIEKFFEDLINRSIISLTNNRCHFFVHHSNENTFTMADAAKKLDELIMNGYKPKGIFIDYLDQMQPSILRYSNNNDYDNQGSILQEMRITARRYSIPIVTITQNAKTSENTMQTMNNTLIGDSYKKVRFSDYIIMIRMREDLDLLNDVVRRDVSDADEELSISVTEPELINNLTPFEVKITKAKDGNRNITKFLLFNKKNLRIYEKFKVAFSDTVLCNNRSQELLEQLSTFDFGDISLLDDMIPIDDELESNVIL